MNRSTLFPARFLYPAALVLLLLILATMPFRGQDADAPVVFEAAVTTAYAAGAGGL